MNDRPASPRGLGRTVPVHAGALQRENARKYLSAGAKSGSLSARPSTAFTRVAAAPARRPVTGGDSPRGAAAQTEPELLHKLVQFVRTELTKLGSPGIDERLEVFRRAFHHFISTFGAYAPFLLAVGRAYDDALEKARGTGADVHDLSSRLATMQSESAQLLGDWRRQAEREKAALLAQGKESERAQAESGRQARKLDLELATTRQELVHLQRQHADAEARIAELNSNTVLSDFVSRVASGAICLFPNKAGGGASIRK